MLTSQQLLERKSYIGGSDVAGIMGLSPWKTPLQIYEDKILDSINQETNDAMHFGSILEDIVSNEFELRSEKKLHRVNQTQFHNIHKFIAGNIDRRVVGERAVFEAKTASSFSAKDWGEEGTDQIPAYYLLQVQLYMEVLKYERCYVAVLIDGRKFQRYEVLYNKALAEIIIENCVNFWENHIIPKVPPEPKSLADLQSLYKTAKIGSAVEATQIESLAVEEIKSIKSTIEDLKKSLKEKEFIVKSYMKDNEILTSNGKPIATYKGLPTSRFDSNQFLIDDPVYYAKYIKETPSRKFLIK